TLHLTCTTFRDSARTVKLSCFVDWATGLVSASTDEPASFLSVDYYPELDQVHASPVGPEASGATWGLLPRPEIDAKIGTGFAEFSCFQHFPALGPTDEMPDPARSDKDRNFALQRRLAGRWSIEALAENQNRLQEVSGSRHRST